MRTSIEDFSFFPLGDGSCEVTYTSPEDGTEYTAVIDDALLLDAVAYRDRPRVCDMNALKYSCIRQGCECAAYF